MNWILCITVAQNYKSPEYNHLISSNIYFYFSQWISQEKYIVDVFYCQYFFMRRDLLHKIQLAKNRVKLIQLSIRFRPNFQTVCLVSANIDGEIETYISSRFSVCILVYSAQYTNPWSNIAKNLWKCARKCIPANLLCLPVSDESGFLILGFGLWKYTYTIEKFGKQNRKKAFFNLL